jgi:arylsulfatase A-like enzyme
VRRLGGAAAWVAAGGLLSLALGACGRAPAPPERPNLVVVTFDTTRLDHTSIGGSARDTTPRLARLAAEGARFETAYAPASSTGPSHATLFTGRYPITHGVRANGTPLPAEALTLAEQLGAAGYDTAGFVGSFVLARRFGLAQGFALWDADFPAEGASVRLERWEGHAVDAGFDRRGDATTDRAIRWLEAREDPRPFFLFVHYFDPHAPYAPPAGAPRFAAEGAGPLAAQIALYDAEVRFADAQLGRLLDALDGLGLSPWTLVAVTADHGEGLMQHGLMGHELQVYEEQVRVPLVLRLPGSLAKGTVVDAPVELVDVAPTLLDLLGVPAGGIAGVGRSLVPALRGGAALPADHPVYVYRHKASAERRIEVVGDRRSEVRARGEKLGVREGRWKYVVGPEEGTAELFDLAADPGETRNLYGPEQREAQRLAGRLARWREAHERGGAAPDLSEEARRGLEALGYVR